MLEINSSGKPPAHDVMDACDYLVAHATLCARFMRGSQGNAIRMIKDLMEERGIKKPYAEATLRKYAKMYRIAARIIPGEASEEEVRWFTKNMTDAAREREYLQKALGSIRH
jgi:hypothetical protein